VNTKNDRTNELISHLPLESSIKTTLKIKESNRAESKLSKCETRNRLLGADIAKDQTKPFNTDVCSRNSSESTTEEK
jgi:hypothetical protein